MPIDIKVPSVGESVTEGSIARWIKSDGDFVRVDEPVFELETEKASNEIPAPASGKLKILKKEGAAVTIGEVVGAIEEASVSAAENAKSPPIPSPAPAQKEETLTVSPAGQRLAKEQGVELAKVTGTGKRGMVLKEDVQAHLDNADAQRFPPAETTDRRETRARMSAIRQRIAQRLVQSQQSTASLTTFNEADLSVITDLRARYKDRFKEKHGVGLGFMGFFVKAAVDALKAFPLVNARIDGDDIVQHHYYNVGVAVSTDKGLMVPVLKDADALSLAEIEKAIASLAARARDGKINPDELAGGTFTITNGGVFGSMLSTPILNPPQSAILGMHAIQKRPVVRDDQVVVRPMMYLALTYDHRLIDGREAVQFLVRIKECLEDPERMLLEI
jgi:2-oxoglutarate dehydrogenase E2 component (dihydrolipoamide succinyltransferase)